MKKIKKYCDYMTISELVVKDPKNAKLAAKMLLDIERGREKLLKRLARLVKNS